MRSSTSRPLMALLIVIAALGIGMRNLAWAGGAACHELDALKTAAEKASEALTLHDEKAKTLSTSPLPARPTSNKNDLINQRDEAQNAAAGARNARGERSRWSTGPDGVKHDTLKQQIAALDQQIQAIKDVQSRAAQRKPELATEETNIVADIASVEADITTKVNKVNGLTNQNERGEDGKEARDKDILKTNNEIEMLREAQKARQTRLAQVRSELYSAEDAAEVAKLAGMETERATLNAEFKPLAQKNRELALAIQEADKKVAAAKNIDMKKVQAELDKWDAFEGGAEKRKEKIDELNTQRPALEQAANDTKAAHAAKQTEVENAAKDLIDMARSVVDLPNLDANLNKIKARVIADAKKHALSQPEVKARKAEAIKDAKATPANAKQIVADYKTFARTFYTPKYQELIAIERGKETARFNDQMTQLEEYDCLAEVVKLRGEIAKAITEKIGKQLVSIGGDIEEEVPDMGEVTLDGADDTGTTGPGEAKTWKFQSRPGAWTSTGIKLKKGQSVDVKVEGKLTNGPDWSTGPDGYYHLGFQAWTFKAKVGSGRLQTIGSHGTADADVDGDLLLAPTYTYEPHPDEGKRQGVMNVTVTGTGLEVDESIANSGGKSMPVGDGKTGDGKTGDGKTGGATNPGSNEKFRNQGDKEILVACPVEMTITDASGRHDSAIPGVSIESKPDGAGGKMWYASLPKGEYTANFTGTGKGAVHVRTKQRGAPEMTYPPMNVDNGTKASLKLTDASKPEPMRTGSVTELSPTAGDENTPAVTAGSGTLPPEISAGKNLRIARWTTFRKITNFPRGEGAQIVSVARFSADGSKIAFGSNQGLFVMNADGTGIRQIQANVPITKLDISANGSKIAWFDRSAKPGLYTANGDGSDITPMPLNGIGSVGALRITADGSRLYALSYEKDGIFVMPTDGSDLKRIVDTASVSKLHGVDENRNHWREVLEISEDGSRVVFHLLWSVFAANGDGSGLHLIHKAKTYGINQIAISRDGRTVIYNDAGEKPAIVFADFEGRELRRFSKISESAWSMLAAPDGGRAMLSPGARFYSADGTTYYDPCEVGTNLWANAMLIGGSADQTRFLMQIDGPESTDQGRPHQFMICELNPSSAIGVPQAMNITAMPKFMLADGSSNATISLKTSVEEPRSVGAVLIINGARPANMSTTSFGMNDTATNGDATKEDGIYTTSAASARTYDGKPLPTGPVGLRVHVLDKDWNLTVVDLEGLEVRAP